MTEVLVSGKDGVAAAPAESNRADLVSAGNETHLPDESLNQWSGNGFAVLHQPWAKGGAGLCGRGRLVDDAAGVALWELGLDGVQELGVKRVALVDIRDVSRKASFCVLVG